VDTPNGQRAFSFGVTGLGLTLSSQWLGTDSITFSLFKGEIYESDYTNVTIVGVIVTTPKQDAEFVKYLESRLGERGGYSIGRHNCRLFSQTMFKKAKALYGRGK